MPKEMRACRDRRADRPVNRAEDERYQKNARRHSKTLRDERFTPPQQGRKPHKRRKRGKIGHGAIEAVNNRAEQKARNAKKRRRDDARHKPEAEETAQRQQEEA